MLLNTERRKKLQRFSLSINFHQVHRKQEKLKSNFHSKLTIKKNVSKFNIMDN